MPASSATAPKVLIVEDNFFQAQLLHSSIEKMGLQVLGPVATASEALHLSTQELPALAILDVSLAGVTDGVELAQQLLQLGPVPIVFASSFNDLATLNRIQQTSPLSVLPKPYNLTGLRRIVELGLYGRMNTPVESEIQVLPEIIKGSLPSPWLFVRERGLLVRVTTADIVCVQMEQKYCTIMPVLGRNYLVRTTLAQMLEYLGSAFTQVHRSWFVQLKKIESVDLTAGIISMVSGIQVPLGRSYRDKVVSQLQLLD
jgi:DNA-binding LytR/AlgR family response regulator